MPEIGLQVIDKVGNSLASVRIKLFYLIKDR